MRFLDNVLDLVFPPRCVGCRTAGVWICNRCLAKTPLITQPLCPRCGRPQERWSSCSVCRSLDFHFTKARAVYRYEGPVKEAIHKLKYRNVRSLAGPLAGLLVGYIEQNPIPADAVVAVPLHEKRLKERGYNQADLLAAEVAKSMQLPLLENVVTRTRYTHPQVGLGAHERHANVSGAFLPGQTSLSGSRILLIDDVYTTGATISDCARALKSAGAAQVHALTIARGL